MSGSFEQRRPFSAVQINPVGIAAANQRQGICVPAYCPPHAIIRWAFLAFVFLIPFDVVGVLGTHTLTKFAGLGFFALAVFQPRQCFGQPPRALIWFLGYLFACAVLASPFFSQYFGELISYFSTLVQLLVMFWLASNLLRDDRTAEQAMFLFSMACGMIALFVLSGVGITEFTSGEGTRQTFGDKNPNEMAVVLGFGVVVLLGVAFQRKNRIRPLRYVLPLLAIPILLAMARTGSRGAVISLAVGLVAIVLQGGSVWIKVRNVLGAMAFAGLLLWAVSGSDMLKVRWLRTLEGGETANRAPIFFAAVEMFIQSPILGWGPIDNLHELSMRVFGDRNEMCSQHNSVMRVLNEVGLAGGIPLAIGVWLCVAAAWRARSGPRGVLPLALLGGIAGASVTGDWMVAKVTWFILAYALASGSGLTRPNVQTLPRGRPV